jgi:hypothetical protein
MCADLVACIASVIRIHVRRPQGVDCTSVMIFLIARLSSESKDVDVWIRTLRLDKESGIL